MGDFRWSVPWCEGPEGEPVKVEVLATTTGTDHCIVRLPDGSREARPLSILHPTQEAALMETLERCQSAAKREARQAKENEDMAATYADRARQDKTRAAAWRRKARELYVRIHETGPKR